MLGGFPNLSSLRIENCSELEEVFGQGENVGESKTKRTFSKLWKLVLKELPKILTFCHSMDEVEFPFLKELEITDCPVMETLVKGLYSVPVPTIGIGTSNFDIQPLFCKEVSNLPF